MVGLENQVPTVILSDAKNLAPTDSLWLCTTPRVYARDEILRFAQNDRGKEVRLTHACTLFTYEAHTLRSTSDSSQPIARR